MPNTTNKTLLWVIAIVIILLGVVYFANPQFPDTASEQGEVTEDQMEVPEQSEDEAEGQTEGQAEEQEGGSAQQSAELQVEL